MPLGRTQSAECFREDLDVDRQPFLLVDRPTGALAPGPQLPALLRCRGIVVDGMCSIGERNEVWRGVSGQGFSRCCVFLSATSRRITVVQGTLSSPCVGVCVCELISCTISPSCRPHFHTHNFRYRAFATQEHSLRTALSTILGVTDSFLPSAPLSLSI